jgi:WD40 repeat protein
VSVDTWTVAFAPDSKFLATGSHSGQINLINLDSGKKSGSLDTRGKFTMSIAYVSKNKKHYFQFIFTANSIKYLIQDVNKTIGSFKYKYFNHREPTCNKSKTFK